MDVCAALAGCTSFVLAESPLCSLANQIIRFRKRFSHSLLRHLHPRPLPQLICRFITACSPVYYILFHTQSSSPVGNCLVPISAKCGENQAQFDPKNRKVISPPSVVCLSRRRKESRNQPRHSQVSEPNK